MLVTFIKNRKHEHREKRPRCATKEAE